MKGEMPNPILAVVYVHNKKKKERITQERKAASASKGGDIATEVATTDVAADSPPDVQGSPCHCGG